MYNTSFLVKYYNIATELQEKLLSYTNENNHDDNDNDNDNDTDNDNNDNNDNEDLGYNQEDINNICDKLYRDELISVFGIELYIDDLNLEYELNKGCQYAMNILNQNTQIPHHTLELLNQNYAILFSYDLFYLTHQCICQQYLKHKIEDELLTQLINTFFIFEQNKEQSNGIHTK